MTCVKAVRLDTVVQPITNVDQSGSKRYYNTLFASNNLWVGLFRNYSYHKVLLMLTVHGNGLGIIHIN